MINAQAPTNAWGACSEAIEPEWGISHPFDWIKTPSSRQIICIGWGVSWIEVSRVCIILMTQREPVRPYDYAL